MATTYLSRTPASAGNRKTWTFSTWFKRGNLGVRLVFLSGTDGGFPEGLNINTSNQFEYDHDIAGTDYTLTSDMLFRDVNAWYHLVVTKDTTQATETDRLKVYVNGNQITLNEVALGYPPLNYDGAINKNVSHTIGNLSTTDSVYFDGSMAHTHFIDGTAYDASTFGETDATTGIWKPKTAPSVTYGTNGFFLKFENSAAFGTDSSGNANNFTVNGTMTQTIDTPSNVFATMNPLHKSLNTDRSFANGNTYVVVGGTARVPEVSTLGMTSGKYYAEMKDIGGSGGTSIMGITSKMYRGDAFDWLGSQSGDYSYYSSAGAKANNASEIGYGDSWTDGDIIGVALDLDNLKIYFSKNGVWQNSGDPTSGATGTGSAFTITAPSLTIDGAYFFACSDDNAYAERRMAWNFGNGYFQTTAVASAQSPSDGIGIFEYEVPTGYKALCTKSINATEYD